MEAKEWTMDLEVKRRPKDRSKGVVEQSEVDALLNEMRKLAYSKGFVLFGLVKAKRENCPHCGKILRSGRALTRCPTCSVVLT